MQCQPGSAPRVPMALANDTLHIAAGALLLAMALEASLRLLPVSTATRVRYHHDPYVLTYPPNQ